jgi:seryl-tRNA synthetase
MEKNVAFVGNPKVNLNRIADFEEQFPDVGYVRVRSTKAQYDIIREYGLANEEKGAELAGARFYYMTNELVMLDMAISLQAMKVLKSVGFIPISPPYLVKRYVEEMATTLDAFKEAIYKIEGEDLFLIPTAEHPIAAFNAKMTYSEKELPLKFAGFSASFRKEAGAHGKDTKGIYRNHHFNKVEQYIVCTPNQAEDMINLTLNNQAELLEGVNIPFRVILLPAWDMDKKALFHADVEGWFPGQNRYGELGSHGYMGTWQSSRLNIKYRPGGGLEPQLANTVYGTMTPVERTLACLLENNLDDDGIIRIPKVLAALSGIDELKPVIRK